MQWHDQIGRALARCDWFVVVLTPRSVSRKWVRRELLYALEDDRYEERIVPLVLEPCDQRALSWVLPQFQAIHFDTSFDDGCRELLRMWGR